MKTKSSQSKTTVVAAAAMVLASTLSHAAVITWGTNTEVASTTDVSTTDTLVEAFNLGSNPAPTTVTVNGVVFTALNKPAPLTEAPPTAFDLLNGKSTGDAAYNSLLSQIAFGGGTGTVTMTLGGGDLVSGNLYQIQLWYVDERTENDSRVMRYGDGLGNTVDVGGSAGDYGHYVIGTFTADGMNQTLSMAPVGFGNSHLTAYQIRAIPEPSAALLTALSGLALFRRRRQDAR